MQYIKILRNSSPLPHVQILQKKKKNRYIFFSLSSAVSANHRNLGGTLTPSVSGKSK